ncbi:MAG: helix-turn-helix transcriptional regulator [Chloroflexota bacterium]|nr:helix-turn-helix transcriptional regulator [Chloroflexota bacterium]
MPRSLGGSVSDGPSFNEWLRTELKARRMSQRLLAERSGVNHSTVSRIVNGERVPRLDTATKLTRELGNMAERDRISTGAPLLVSHPTARVEEALRADALLSESQVRRIMECYLALRIRHLPTGNDAPMLRSVRPVARGQLGPRSAGRRGVVDGVPCDFDVLHGSGRRRCSLVPVCRTDEDSRIVSSLAWC